MQLFQQLQQSFGHSVHQIILIVQPWIALHGTPVCRVMPPWIVLHFLPLLQRVVEPSRALLFTSWFFVLARAIGALGPFAFVAVCVCVGVH